MDIKSDVLAIIDDLFMEDVSDMMDEDLFDAGVLDSMGTVELIVELESHFDIDIPISEFGRDDWNTANKIIAGIKNNICLDKDINALFTPFPIDWKNIPAGI